MGIIGIAVLVSIAVLLSEDRRRINIRVVGSALLLQVLIAVVVLYIPAGQRFLGSLSNGVQGIVDHVKAGTGFLFGDLGSGVGFVFVLQVLPIIIFISSLMAVLYYINVMQVIVRILGAGLRAIVGTGRVVSLCATANIFIGHTESPLVVKPYLKNLSREQLFMVMSSGLASVSGAILIGYSALGIQIEYLIAAAFMSAPGGLLFANLLVPLKEGDVESDDALEAAEAEEERPTNVIEAAADGAATGLKLAANIAAMLLAFIALISLANGLLSWMGDIIGFEGVTLELILGWIFAPIMFVLGVPWADAVTTGNLMGQKLILNEFVAFVSMLDVQDGLSPKGLAIITFALCGFANLNSLAILVGGLGGLVPERRRDISKLGLKAVLAGSLSNMMSASIAGVLLFW
ncbi:MAG: NupC/NupG family nucleoside CNT transporter [Gammaproteobacteria bacterium]|nr:NupC/NupG family nucleoside CNT transporter [Gammaproteobacteria bacterium]